MKQNKVTIEVKITVFARLYFYLVYFIGLLNYDLGGRASAVWLDRLEKYPKLFIKTKVIEGR